MHRIAKQLEISHSISSCEDNTLIIKWLQALATGLGINTVQHFVSDVFLLLKSKYSDEHLDVLLQHAQDINSRRNNNSSTPANHNYKINTNTNSNSCKISQFPKDIFNNIGSYLDIKSSLALSIANHLFHQLIHNNSYFETSKKQTSRLELTEKKLQLIYKYNCCMSSFSKFFELKLYVSDKHEIIEKTARLDEFQYGYQYHNHHYAPYGTYATRVVETINCVPKKKSKKSKQNSNNNNRNRNHNYKHSCNFINIHHNHNNNNSRNRDSADSEVESDISSDDDSGVGMNENEEEECILGKIVNEIELNCNYDLMWIKKVFGEAKNLLVSNEWKCAFDHIPMEWIFGIRDNNNNNNDNNYLETLGSTSSNFCLSCGALKKLVEKYNDYIFVNNCQSDNYKGRVRQIRQIRQIQRIWYNVKSKHNWKLLSKLNGNFQGIMIRLCDQDLISRFKNLKQFFRIFHSNLTVLEIYLAGYNSLPGDRNGIINSGFLSLLFKRNDKLIKQLTTTETQLAFEKFLTMNHCDVSNLPKIEQLLVNFIKNGEDRAGIELLKNDKLMKLVNLSNSVKSVCFQFYKAKNSYKLKNSCIKWIQNLHNLVKVGIIICVTKDASIFDIEQFYNQFLLDLVFECVILNKEIKIIDIDIGYEPQIYNQANISEVVIENNQMLLHKARNELKQMILDNVIKPRFDVIKNVWKFKFDQLVNETEQISERIVIKRSFQV